MRWWKYLPPKGHPFWEFAHYVFIAAVLYGTASTPSWDELGEFLLVAGGVKGFSKLSG